jgi:CheY-like chemotaxis protein
MKGQKEIPQELKDKVRILIVEDNLLNQKLVRFMLKNWGFKCDISSNGKLAIKNLEENKYDLILMDIEMPEMNGYVTSQYIRNNLNLTTPIIATTAHVSRKEKEKCVNFGMTDYISKPIKGEELNSLIINYLFPNNK